VDGYDTLNTGTPHRHHFDRRSFAGHDGRPGSGARTKQIKEHLAIALVDGGSTSMKPMQEPVEVFIVFFGANGILHTPQELG
jgi:hypothetical protein